MLSVNFLIFWVFYFMIRTEVFMSSRSSIQSVMSYLAVSQSIDTKYVTNHVILMLGISFMIVIVICYLFVHLFLY